MWQHVSAESTLFRRPLKKERNASEVERDERTHDSGISSRTGSHSTSDWCASPSLPRPTRHGSVCDVEETVPSSNQIRKKKLIDDLKMEVKILMEHAAGNDRVDLNSGYVTSLCIAVQNCVMDGIRKRFLGLIGMKTSLALLHTVAKGLPSAQIIIDRTAQNERNESSFSSQIRWIRESLHLKLLSSILDFIATSKEMHRLYDDDALLRDRSKSGMPSALLLGPCAITFKRMSIESTETMSRIEWSDRMRDVPPSNSTSSSRPPLSVKRQGSSLVSMERQSTSRDYVFSLHANYRSTLLYGKNNVGLEDTTGGESTKGYLSLHKNFSADLTIRWTPNQLMTSSSQPNSATSKDEGKFQWKQAVTIEMNQVIYIHLHQKHEECSSCITFVTCEGGQSPPLHFPSGQHSLVFLTALESGLTPLYRLDPPLAQDQSKEKTLPRLRRRTSATNSSSDYVFRIVRLTSEISPPLDQTPSDDLQPSIPPSPTNGFFSLPNSPAMLNTVDDLVNTHMGQACRSMQHQILARAFFGWLSYVRHLRTVREHLIGLIHNKEMAGSEDLPLVDETFWNECRMRRTSELFHECLLRVYWSGIGNGREEEDKSLRRQVWPYLLGVFEWSESPEPKTTQVTEKYRNDVEEWRVLEAEVRRRDEEAFNAARARKGATPIREMSITSDVFDEETEEKQDTRDTEWEDLIDKFGANLHRIEKDVERCDRALRFFSNPQNLESLRRVVCTYVRRNLDGDGYVQGMCDIAAPLLVIFQDEALTLECYTVLMERMKDNFPHHAGMDRCLSNLRSLVQVVDPHIFSLLSTSADFTQLYFSYRWFLLDFKRELPYDGVFRVWETIWACGHLQSKSFPLFFSLAMLTNYRDTILANNMDFADLIKFFNDMTARHDVLRLLSSARSHLSSLTSILQSLD
ncbi:hypothetical protein PFISCL1PPCAC_10629 [Pristionchus fissidentatus]|uniref:Tbc-8 n=1 Tax=Pristionchus fissidentatus TaxID=1538716 RepID=A0AAV5VMR3_9BILA|nr:hypothetical protein PFISCL1PPCAC_10629 [Pristionchus fissidentatus]